MKKRKESSVAEFLKAAGAYKPRCVICDNKPISAAIDEIIAARKAGTSGVSSVAVMAFLRDQFGAKFSVSLLRKCCEDHRGCKWSDHARQ